MGLKRICDKGVRSRQKETSESYLRINLRFSRLRVEVKLGSGRTGTEFHGELWIALRSVIDT